MKILSHIPANARSLEQLILDTAHNKAYLSLLKTWYTTRYFFNNYIISLMGGEEHAERVTPRYNAAEDREAKLLSAAKVIDLQNGLPEHIGSQVQTAQYAGMGNKYRLVLLKGGGLELLVEARSFSTLHDRHPGACWRFAAGINHWAKPVVLTRDEGFVKGEMVGAIVPISFKDVEKAVAVAKPAITGTLKKQGRMFIYEG